jgi:hypothetical protein
MQDRKPFIKSGWTLVAEFYILRMKGDTFVIISLA